jgi:hypothetical protein
MQATSASSSVTPPNVKGSVGLIPYKSVCRNLVSTNASPIPESDGQSCEGQQQVLGEQLSNQPSTIGAERLPNGELGLPA